MVHPSFGFWNAAALFHTEPWRARAKLDHFKGIAKRMDITFAAECHIKEGDCVGLACTHYEYSSPDPHNPRASGGMIIAINKAFHDRHHCKIRVLHAGRAVAVDICHPDTQTFSCTVAGVHITETPQHTWRHVAESVVEQLGMNTRVFIVGDFNFVDDAFDSINVAGEGVGSVGYRSQLWARLLPRFTQIQAGLTHYHKAKRCMSALDRMYTSMDPAEVLAHGLTLRMTGGRKNRSDELSDPLALSDHHSIEASWRSSNDVVQLPQWIFRDPLWPSTVACVETQLWVPGLGWREQVVLLERIIHDAAKEIREFRKIVCRTNHRQVLVLCLRALRHLEAGDLAEVKRLCSMAPHLKIGPSSGRDRIHKILCSTACKAHDTHLEEITKARENVHGNASSSSASGSPSFAASRTL
eukprot:253789-Amphidinium_carterae.1